MFLPTTPRMCHSNSNPAYLGKYHITPEMIHKAMLYCVINDPDYDETCDAWIFGRRLFYG